VSSPVSWGFLFNGHNNLGAFLDTLLADATAGPALRSAKNFLLTGSSAGGIGTFMNADYLRARLPWVPNFRANPVGGWFFPGDTEDQPEARCVRVCVACVACVCALLRACVVCTWLRACMRACKRCARGVVCVRLWCSCLWRSC
jgi:hypothetical protein